MRNIFAKWQMGNIGLHDVEWKPGTPKRIKDAYRGFVAEKNAKTLRTKNQTPAA